MSGTRFIARMFNVLAIMLVATATVGQRFNADLEALTMLDRALLIGAGGLMQLVSQWLAREGEDK